MSYDCDRMPAWSDLLSAKFDRLSNAADRMPGDRYALSQHVNDVSSDGNCLRESRWIMRSSPGTAVMVTPIMSPSRAVVQHTRLSLPNGPVRVPPPEV